MGEHRVLLGVSWAVSLALCACGQTTQLEGAGFSVAGQAGAANVDGTSSSGGHEATTAGASGAAGTISVPEPLADISGRWGMFDFEDAVGVHLIEGKDGSLTGRGCAAGAPGYSDNESSLCGDLTGKVVGSTATFSFEIPEVGRSKYSAKLVISADRQRMTGSFNNGIADSTYPMAWLRIRDGEVWLDRAAYDEKDPLMGRYELWLLPDGNTGTEYVADKPYGLSYWRHAFRGDLGSFWSSEMTEPSQGSPINVGPVPATLPALPTTLGIDFDDAGFKRITVRTGSGGFYTFSASKLVLQ